MNVFISWSGPRSCAVAEFLRDWIKCVLQGTQPWLSTRDIDRGALWLSEINDRLKETSIGIICLTMDNRSKPWILFEAGALAKGLSSNRVCTFLVDLRPSDLENPLAQFNHTIPDKANIWEMVRTINRCLGETSLDEPVLRNVFETYWPQFDERFQAILKTTPDPVNEVRRQDSDILSELLDTTRQLASRIGEMERLGGKKISKLSSKHYRSSSNPLTKENLITTIRQYKKMGFTEGAAVEAVLKQKVPESVAFLLVSDVYKESNFGVS